MKEHEISIKSTCVTDNLFGNWYKCPKCEDYIIYEDSKFCSNCGTKIIWK